ncbi:prepilin-type N-terminal cleavage/methylation domain-containing protein [Desulfuromonas acetoxidans]|uniref:General secretion pathway protein H n=1 Tax=Desulfuromonas acetoxidans (strain DSM 684 / 11070) TaxID=281689 RepID=Q1JVV1_DESA6|nr:prepilin-type N-terminal cleavage/methylation domain-containing protein [Desulfuromonas acetoxidans]EAT14375.1 conserved hypothetical protein [Desulfuromonas acetoxidans DSM 684]MBF0647016.1 prepilin-type N-terminal cleavage/methylation domain-containing protein [Desulfuromonas acetoxidans]NVD26019.1 prepilin-type N-terminal cleavage/methylation domain-containing protein [Desulfuromonas acetoxidans]NVE16965.1 prepilin-type N-terminal cleavage/methylation domain-containing protein [Desulfurom
MPTLKVGRLNNSRGFTLVELSIVVALISLFAVLSVPLLGSVAENNLNHSARRLAGMVKYLFNETALTATQHRLVFNLDDNLCTVEQLSELGEWQTPEGRVRQYRFPGNVDIKDIWVDERGKMTTGTVTITFHPQGWLPQTTVHLQQDKQDDGNELTIHLLPFTGSAEIEEGYHEFDDGNDSF